MPTNDAERRVEPGRPSVRVRPSVLLSLVAGRGAWRLAVFGGNALLLAIWGDERFAGYASALGMSTLLIPLVSAGVEKASLKLLPRARRSRQWLAGGLIAIACVAGVPLLAWFAIAWLTASGGNGALQFAAAVFTSLVGVNVLLVALHRAFGKPSRDVQSYVVLAAAMLAAAGLAAVLPVTPIQVLLIMIAVVVPLNLWLLRSLRPAARFRGLRGRPALLRCLGGTAGMMSFHDMAIGGSVSLVFFALASSRFHTDSAYLYVVVSAWAPFAAGFNYLLRVFQPQVSLALAGGASAARHRAHRIATLALGGWGVVALVALGGAGLGAAGVLSWPPALPLVVALGVLLVGRGMLAATASGAVYLLENGDARSLRLVAKAAACGIAAALALAFPLAARFGAVGGVVTLGTYDVVLATIIAFGTRGGPRAAEPAPAATRRGGVPAADSGAASLPS